MMLALLPAFLLLCAAIAHHLPGWLVAEFGGSVSAWEAVCYGTEAALLWGFFAFASFPKAVRAVAFYGVIESAMRPACRLAFPMSSPPRTEGRSLCYAATGVPLDWLSICAALVLLLYLTGRKKDGG